MWYNKTVNTSNPLGLKITCFFYSPHLQLSRRSLYRTLVFEIPSGYRIIAVLYRIVLIREVVIEQDLFLEFHFCR